MIQKFSKQKKFTKADVELYAKLTGDYNPVHFNEEFAKTTIFGKPIVHGPLVLTFVTTLFATDLPGPGTVYLAHDVKYIKPVYIDDEITAILEVEEITEKNHILISTTCVNQRNEIVLTGLARLKKM
jgi:3-hydroxybutyryl-CoA dehydratase